MNRLRSLVALSTVAAGVALAASAGFAQEDFLIECTTVTIVTTTMTRYSDGRVNITQETSVSVTCRPI